VTVDDAGCLDEDTAAGFLSRALPDRHTQSVIAHAAECGSCRRFLAALASTTHATTDSQRETIPHGELGPLLAELQPSECVDRYVIRRRIGVGAMGVVYAALDPQLDREVALKILDRTVPDLGEARAMAQLAHPNIVPVFDAGTFEGRGFVAMELVRGATLTHWLRDAKHSWRAIVDRFREAAAGLAAVHAAGLIHGDFKPDNVLVGDDGRARVADFGLAQPSGVNDAAGTPAYMAPERLAGRAADARADQYSFCVALHEALCGARPGEGATPDVPRRLRHAIEGGLAHDPAKRFPSMDALAAALAIRPRPWIAIGVGGALVAGGLAALAVFSADDTADCEPPTIAEWNPSVKSAMQGAFARVARASDEDSAGAVTRFLDQRTAEWSERHVAACKAHARGDESAALYERRRNCLDNQRTAIQALLDLFANPDAQIVGSALESARAAIALEPCSAPTPPASTIPRDAEGLEVRRALARVRALELVGKIADAIQLAESLVPRAKHDPRLSAQLHAQLGKLLDDAGQANRAEETLLQGVAAAERGGDDSMKATLLVQLVWTVGISNGRYDEGERLGRLAIAALERSDDPGLRAALAYMLGNLDDARGRRAEAIVHYEAALALYEEHSGRDSADTAPTLSALGMVTARSGDLDKALGYFERARTALESLYDKHHPMVALVLINIASVHSSRGDFEKAIAIDREALAIQEAVFGPDHEKTAMVVTGLADVYRAAEKWDEALALYRRAVDSFTRALGDKHPMLLVPLFGVGSAEHALGRSAAAIPWLERALVLCKASGSPPEDCAEIEGALVSAKAAVRPARGR
jgi:tetratricopeptide (TPR) repeat protein/tRNA A-37 threonylcarbamoyl transferase component Bud32